MNHRVIRRRFMNNRQDTPSIGRRRHKLTINVAKITIGVHRLRTISISNREYSSFFGALSLMNNSLRKNSNSNHFKLVVNIRFCNNGIICSIRTNVRLTRCNITTRVTPNAIRISITTRLNMRLPRLIESWVRVRNAILRVDFRGTINHKVLKNRKLPVVHNMLLMSAFSVVDILGLINYLANKTNLISRGLTTINISATINRNRQTTSIRRLLIGFVLRDLTPGTFTANTNTIEITALGRRVLSGPIGNRAIVVTIFNINRGVLRHLKDNFKRRASNGISRKNIRSSRLITLLQRLLLRTMLFVHVHYEGLINNKLIYKTATTITIAVTNNNCLIATNNRNRRRRRDNR